jgi:predicted ATPase
MHVRQITVRNFKRFTDLTVVDLPATVRLVVLTGPNGSGKSSLFDAFRVWHHFHGGGGLGYDRLYYSKKGLADLGWSNHVRIEFHEAVPSPDHEKKKLVYIRSAYRNEADFTTDQLRRAGDLLDAPKISRLIDNDAIVSQNYQRLVAATVEGVYSGAHDAASVAELRERFIGRVRTSMSHVFDDLLLRGPGDPLQDGSFFFEKGVSVDFHYKNLSAGEKAAFDILLDILVKQISYDNTVYCIDEPEIHMHTRLQARLLEELFSLVPQTCQLWISTHSIGMMRKARDLHSTKPEEVAFLDFHDQNFDDPVILRPVPVSRAFWAKTLEIALDDLAQLVAPRRVVLCEGKAADPAMSSKAEFDAKCYRVVFAAEFPDTDFLSVGNEADVRSDRLGVGRAIQTLVAGTQVTRLIDRDDRSPVEIAELEAAGVRVLSRRHLEAYLLDDEVLTELCRVNGQPAQVSAVLTAKANAVAESVARSNPADDLKSAAGKVYTECKRLLGLTGVGNNTEAFMRDTLAPLIKKGSSTYDELKRDVFGS